MNLARKIAELEALRCLAPSQVSDVVRQLCASAIPVDAKARLGELERRCSPLEFRVGVYPFPVITSSSDSPVKGGVVLARCVVGGMPMGAMLASKALSNQRLARHLEERSRQRQQTFCLEPAAHFDETSLPIKGDSCELAFAIADLSAESGLEATGRVVLSGRLEWLNGEFAVDEVTGALSKLRTLESELPGCTFFVCCAESELAALNSSVVRVIPIAARTPLRDVFVEVKEKERTMRQVASSRELWGVERARRNDPVSRIALEEALAMPVRNDVNPNVSFEVRLAFELPFDPFRLSSLISHGWRAIEPAPYYSWFAKIDLVRLERWAQHILHWVEMDRVRRPAVLSLELNKLKGASLVGSDVPELRLSSIDLIPLSPATAGGTHRAALGITVTGSPCTLGQFLSFTGSRADLMKMRLHAKQDGDANGLTLARLVAELNRSLSAGDRPVLIDRPAADLSELRTTAYRPHLWQTIHLTESEWPTEPSVRHADLLETVWMMVGTVSMPKPGYPKEVDLLKEPAGLSKRTRYGLHDKGDSFLLGGTEDKFNQTTKPRITMETHYLHYLLAREHAMHSNTPVSPADVQATFEQEHHRKYFEFCQAFHGRRSA